MSHAASTLRRLLLGKASSKRLLARRFKCVASATGDWADPRANTSGDGRSAISHAGCGIYAGTSNAAQAFATAVVCSGGRTPGAVAQPPFSMKSPCDQESVFLSAARLAA